MTYMPCPHCGGNVDIDPRFENQRRRVAEWMASYGRDWTLGETLQRVIGKQADRRARELVHLCKLEVVQRPVPGWSRVPVAHYRYLEGAAPDAPQQLGLFQ